MNRILPDGLRGGGGDPPDSCKQTHESVKLLFFSLFLFMQFGT